jgi:hypothetical protein
MNSSIQGSKTVAQEFDWDSVVNQIFEMIGTNTAIIGQYGLILASRIQGFEKQKLLSPLLWDVIHKRIQIAKELGVKEVHSLVLETDIGNINITFGEYIGLISIVPPNVDLSQLMPSLSRFLKTLDKTTDKSLGVNVEKLVLDAEYNEFPKEKDKERESFPIFKDLIKFLAAK